MHLHQVAQIRAAGEEPYAYSFDPTHKAEALQLEYSDLEAGKEVDGIADVRVAGRVMASRFMGKLAFISLLDESGTIQVNQKLRFSSH